MRFRALKTEKKTKKNTQVPHFLNFGLFGVEKWPDLF